MNTYRWSGTDRRGTNHSGRCTGTSAEMAEMTEQRFRQGWRELTVCTGDGPVPPRWDEDSVGGIGSYTGRRTWWAER